MQRIDEIGGQVPLARGFEPELLAFLHDLLPGDGLVDGGRENAALGVAHGSGDQHLVGHRLDHRGREVARIAGPGRGVRRPGFGARDIGVGRRRAGRKRKRDGAGKGQGSDHGCSASSGGFRD
ncbi:MAG: hypothetical protein ACE368_03755 [Paracoccaceae bacterium]